MAFSGILPFFLVSSKLFIVALLNLFWESLLLFPKLGDLLNSLGTGQFSDSPQGYRDFFVVIVSFCFPFSTYPSTWVFTCALLTVFDDLIMAQGFLIREVGSWWVSVPFLQQQPLLFEVCTFKDSFISALRFSLLSTQCRPTELSDPVQFLASLQSMCLWYFLQVYIYLQPLISLEFTPVYSGRDWQTLLTNYYTTSLHLSASFWGRLGSCDLLIAQ